MKQGFFRRYAASLTGVASVGIVYFLTLYPRISPEESSKVASRFKFTKLPIPEVASHPLYKNVRAVQPSLSRISAWISSLGAGAVLADLDGDGLPNDLILTDPRTDLVTVAPA